MQRRVTEFESGSCPSDGRDTVSRITGLRRLRGAIARRLALLHLETPAPPDSAPGKAMKQITVNTYRQDKYYPRVVRAVAKILSRSDVVAPVEVLLEMGN